jgi:hypothetical protein
MATAIASRRGLCVQAAARCSVACHGELADFESRSQNGGQLRAVELLVPFEDLQACYLIDTT